MKVLINDTYGGFLLSGEAYRLYKERTNRDYDGQRDDADMVAIVERIGSERASGAVYSKIAIVEIEPLAIEGQSTSWRITQYDGVEWVETPIPKEYRGGDDEG